MDVLTSEICWALNNEIIRQATSSWSIFIQLSWWCTFQKHKIFPPNLPLSDKGCVIKEWWNWSMSNVSKCVQHTSLMTVASRRPTHKDECEGITGGRTDCGKPMSHYLRYTRYIAFCPSWTVANERNQFIRRRNFSTRSTLKRISVLWFDVEK